MNFDVVNDYDLSMTLVHVCWVISQIIAHLLQVDICLCSELKKLTALFQNLIRPGTHTIIESY